MAGASAVAAGVPATRCPVVTVAKVSRVASRSAVSSFDMAAACGGNARPYVVGLLGGRGRSVGFSAKSADEAERYAVERLAKDATLFGAVVSFEPPGVARRLVSRVFPG